MGAVKQLCNRIVHLGAGKVISDAVDVDRVIDAYLNAKQTDVKAFWTNPGGAYPNRWFVPLKFGLVDREGRPVSGTVHPRDEVWVYVEGFAEHPNPALVIAYALRAGGGAVVYYSAQTDSDSGENSPGVLKGKISLRSRLLNHLLSAGTYSLEFSSSIFRQEYVNRTGISAPPPVFFQIDGSISSSPYWSQQRGEGLAPLIAWECC
jgi:hypothetical protein